MGGGVMVWRWGLGGRGCYSVEMGVGESVMVWRWG